MLEGAAWPCVTVFQQYFVWKTLLYTSVQGTKNTYNYNNNVHKNAFNVNS